MQRNLFAALLLVLATHAAAGNACAAQAPTPSQQASDTTDFSEAGPAQIAAAHKIFLGNAEVVRNFPLSADETYNIVYAALKAWGHYELVSASDEADLIFELRGVAPVRDITGLTGSQYSPKFDLAIVDPHTKVVLWTVTSPITLAGPKRERARWKAVAARNLVTRVKMAAAQPVSSGESEDLYLGPENHHLRNVLLVPVIVVAGIMVLFLVAR